MCLDEGDVEFVQPYLDAIYCKQAQQAVMFALSGRYVCLTMDSIGEGMTIPSNVLIVSSWFLFMDENGQGAEEALYLH